ncbi:type II toxin-antitoxin system YafQ family toxin [Moraxella lincolnii]|uniref:type II toxin-antitoxin system YafQ family toxin n=1 Tax=Lwoffella lincolnii TaxID=90241 RepID=UPI0030D239B9
MRKLVRSKDFDRDFRKVDLSNELLEVLSCLINDLPLDPKYKDLTLTGNWKDYRECHIKPDLLLVYRKESIDGKDILKVARLSSHSNIFSVKKRQKK